MGILRSLCSAFLMYSRIPVPQVEWKEENRRYALCFFPCIGVVIGTLLVLWQWCAACLGVNDVLFAIVAAAIPVWITGGIHLDGFCDVHDAKASCGTKEQLLAIMQDSHIGAFAVIHLALYFLLQIGLFSQLYQEPRMLWICAIGFVQSRAWSGLAAITLKSAKSSGALQSFRKPAEKRITIVAELFFLIGTSAAMLWIAPICGTCAILGGGVALLRYRMVAYRKFGGITGDLAGYFLQQCELLILLFVTGGSLILEAIL